MYLKVNLTAFCSFYSTSFLINHRVLNSLYLLIQQFSYNKSKKVQNFINLLIQLHRCRMIDIFETLWSKKWPNSNIFHFTFAFSCFHFNFCYILIHRHNQNFLQSHQQIAISNSCSSQLLQMLVCFFLCSSMALLFITEHALISVSPILFI